MLDLSLKPARLAAFAVLAAFALAAPLRAETIHLVGGQMLEGEVVKRSASEVSVKTPEGIVPIPLSRIAKAEPDALTKAKASLAAGNAAAARKSAEIVLFWEPKNQEARALAAKAATRMQEQGPAKPTGAALEKEAAEAAEFLQKAMQELATHPPDPPQFKKELTELRNAAKEAATLYKGTPQEPLLASLVDRMNQSLDLVGQVINAKTADAQGQDEVSRKMKNAPRAKAGTAPKEKIATINKPGQKVDIAAFAVPGGITMIDFYADWCGPCKRLSPILEEFVNSTEGVFLRKVDIKEWKSPVAEQYVMRSIPSVWIFDREGKLVAERLQQATDIQEALRKAMK